MVCVMVMAFGDNTADKASTARRRTTLALPASPINNDGRGESRSHVMPVLQVAQSRILKFFTANYFKLYILYILTLTFILTITLYVVDALDGDGVGSTLFEAYFHTVASITETGLEIFDLSMMSTAYVSYRESHHVIGRTLLY